MSGRDLLRDPCWQASDLGHPLPDSVHAVSVALPRWQDVIAYEEKDPACREALRAIYPRFGFHPLVAELARCALAGNKVPDAASAWPYPTAAAARAAQAHCRRTAHEGHTSIVMVRDLPCLIADQHSTAAAKAFWQHAGLGASSRLAAIALGRETAPATEAGVAAKRTLIERLARIYGCPTAAISLHPSGMAALHQALRRVCALHPGRPTLQIGFPYVDVLKQPQVLFHGGDLLLDPSPSAVEAALDRLQPMAVVVELPSNPLLRCVDLAAIAELAHARAIPVIADDTIGSGLNIDALPYADLVFSSLTKSFAGRGDVLAGSLIVSPGSRWLRAGGDDDDPNAGALAPLADADAIALEVGSRDLEERLPRLNRHALELAERLAQHPAVARVFHPAGCPNFRALMRRPTSGHGCSAPGHGCFAPGHGCLLSFELKGGSDKAQRVYDALAVCKGPSLGTTFTLCCPYVLLAHYDELSWAESCGVPSHLLRVSVGLEDPDELWSRFHTALAA